MPKFTDRYPHVSFNSAALEQLCVILDLMHPVSLMAACASFGFASGALEQAKFGVPFMRTVTASGIRVLLILFLVTLATTRGYGWMTMQRIFLHVPWSDAVKEYHWPACLRKHVRS